jgi:hypothetical protein
MTADPRRVKEIAVRGVPRNDGFEEAQVPRVRSKT